MWIQVKTAVHLQGTVPGSQSWLQLWLCYCLAVWWQLSGSASLSLSCVFIFLFAVGTLIANSDESCDNRTTIVNQILINKEGTYWMAGSQQQQGGQLCWGVSGRGSQSRGRSCTESTWEHAPRLPHLPHWTMGKDSYNDEAGLTLTLKRMILKSNVLNERNQIQKSLFYMIPFVRNSTTGKTHL